MATIKLWRCFCMNPWLTDLLVLSYSLWSFPEKAQLGKSQDLSALDVAVQLALRTSRRSRRRGKRRRKLQKLPLWSMTISMWQIRAPLCSNLLSEARFSVKFIYALQFKSLGSEIFNSIYLFHFLTIICYYSLFFIIISFINFIITVKKMKQLNCFQHNKILRNVSWAKNLIISLEIIITIYMK